MCLNFIKSVFRRGDAQGNIPSPRLDITIGDIFSYKTTTVQNTNSMEPLIDIGHTVFLSNKPEHTDNLKAGDIIVWRGVRGDVIHSIIETGIDATGWYCKTQGINVNLPDPEIIRKENIVWVCLGVLWTKGSAVNGD